MKRIHPFLQNQLAVFKNEHGELSQENALHLLLEISETYNEYERRMAEKKAVAGVDTTPHMQHVQETIQKLKEVLFSVDMIHYELLFITEACREMYGYSVKEFHLNSKLWFDAIVEEDKAGVEANYGQLVQGRSLVQEYRIRRKDGAIRWVESRMEAILNEQGQLVRLDGITLDITDFKQGQIALQNSEIKFRSLIENAYDALTIADEQLQLTFASKALKRMTGFEPDEYIGTPVFNYFHADEFEMLRQITATVMANPGVPVPVTCRFLKQDGSWIWVEASVTNMLHLPAVNGIVANFRDITERITNEGALRQSNETLKKANEELDRFVYSVSHDLRAPLASVLGAIEYSATETTDPEMLDNLAMMKASILKLDVFIMDILDYSRNSRMELKKQDIDFNELLHDLRSNLKFITSGNDKVDIRIGVTGSHQFASDKSRISIILNNLVSNAIRYYNPVADHPFVDVNVDLNEDAALVTVKDNGVGIEPKYQEKVFDMFFRASKKSNGSGLGLYIFKEALNKLQGSMTLQSEVGVGTVFNITIPNLKQTTTRSWKTL